MSPAAWNMCTAVSVPSVRRLQFIHRSAHQRHFVDRSAINPTKAFVPLCRIQQQSLDAILCCMYHIFDIQPLWSRKLFRSRKWRKIQRIACLQVTHQLLSVTRYKALASPSTVFRISSSIDFPIFQRHRGLDDRQILLALTNTYTRRRREMSCDNRDRGTGAFPALPRGL